MRLPVPAAGMIPHMLRPPSRRGRGASGARDSPAGVRVRRARRADVCSASARSRRAPGDPPPARRRDRSSAASASSVSRATRISRPGSKKRRARPTQSVSIGAPQAAASNSRPDGHQPISAIACAGHVQRQPRRGEERRVLGRRQVADEVDVVRPGEIRRDTARRRSRTAARAAAAPARRTAPPAPPAGRRRRCRDRTDRSHSAAPGGTGRCISGIDMAVERRDAARAEPVRSRPARARPCSSARDRNRRGPRGRWRSPRPRDR